MKLTLRVDQGDGPMEVTTNLYTIGSPALNIQGCKAGWESRGLTGDGIKIH